MLLCHVPYRVVGNGVGKVVTIPGQTINDSRLCHDFSWSSKLCGNETRFFKKLSMKGELFLIDAGNLIYRAVCIPNCEHDGSDHVYIPFHVNSYSR